MRIFPIILATTLALGCGGSTSANNQNNGGTCTGGKCDTPNNDPNYDVAEQCESRRAEMLDANRQIFLEDAVRWSCADVRGVNTNNKDSRGQEYCEYWAGLRLPPAADGEPFGESVTLGRPLSDAEGDVTPLSLDLSEDQIFYLEDHADEILGSCYFSTWHNDVDAPLPVCADTESCATTADGIPLDAETFRMKLSFNGNEAAYLLVQDCLNGVLGGSYETGDPTDEENPLTSDFVRGCHLADAFGLAWRKSDSSICGATMRLAECGCVSDPSATARALLPEPESGALRGFPLGGWASAETLPSGCEYIQTGEDSRTLVRCDLTGSDILGAQSDLKGYCQSRYGDNVVVYIPIPADSISCETPSEGPYTDTCGDTPWVITQ